MLLLLWSGLSNEPCMDASTSADVPHACLAQGAPDECDLLHIGYSRNGALTSFAAGSRERLQRLDIQDDDRTVFETNPATGRPGAQLLVDAFAGHADHLADFLLSDRDRAATLRGLMSFREANQRAGEPARQVLKDDLFDLVAGPSQPAAKQLDELHRQRRLASHKRNEFTAVDDEDFAIGVRDRVSGSLSSVEQGDFPKNLAGPDQIQNRAAAIGRRDAHLRGTRYDHVQTVAGITFGIDRGTPFQGDWLGVAAELVERLRIEIAENRMPPQHRQLVARKLPSFLRPVLRHANQISRSGTGTRPLRT